MAKVPNALTIGPFGSDLKVPDYRDEGVPLVFVREIRAGRFGDGRTKYVDEAKAAKLSRHYVRPGDLLVTTMGDPPGDTAVYPPERPPAIITADCIKLTPHTGLTIAEFLRDCLRAEPVKSQLLEQTAGVAQQKLSLERFRIVRLPVPPLNEQRRIVAKLEALQARSRRAREALDAVQPLLEKLRQSILAAAFRGDLTKDWRAKHKDVEPASELLKRIRAERRKKWEESELAKMKAKGKAPTDDKWKAKYKEPEPVDATGLPELPEGWCWANLGEVFEVCVGATPSRAEASYWGGDVPWVSSGEVAFCHIRATRESITKVGLSQTSTKLHPPGTVLLGMIGEGKTRGQAAILDVEACNNQNSAAIRVSATDVPPEYVYRYLEYEYERTRNVGSGNNQQALNKARVEAIHIVMAPLEEQRVLQVRLDELLGVADRLARAVAETGERRQQLERATLAKAFRGELVPQDPNDEPAEAMLARLRGANGAATSEAKPKRGRMATAQQREMVDD